MDSGLRCWVCDFEYDRFQHFMSLAPMHSGLVDTIVDAHELTAQVRHLKPLLQTQVKYVHTPLIQ
ncbi:hypothetical protein NECAME_11236, partial [Necator americanus]